MCWTSNSKPIKQVADDDIPVFKLCMRSSENIILPYHYGRDLTYMVGGTYSSDIRMVHAVIGWETLYNIHEGLHSFSPKCTINPLSQGKISVCTPKHKEVGGWYSTDRLCVLLCLIPKGATYYLNDNEEYVSDTIKVVKAIDYPRTSYIYNHTDVNNKAVSINKILNKWTHKKIEIK